MKYFCLLLLCSAVALAADQAEECKDVKDLTEEELEEIFQQHLRDLQARESQIDGDNSGEPADVEERKKSFKEAAEKIKDANEKNADFKQKISEFASMTAEEKAARKGLHISDEAKAEFKREQKKRELELMVMKRAGFKRTLPESVDHCAWTGPVENQGGCGSCYTFSASHVLTGRMKMRDGEDAKTVPISEQQAVNCVYNRDGCDGGWMPDVWKMWNSQHVATDTKVPYTGKYEPSNTVCAKEDGRVDPKFSTTVYKAVAKNNVEDMKAAVAEGPVAIAMNVRDDFQNFASGVYSTKDTSCADTVNHAMLVCGYGFDRVTGKNYWLVKNSWGENWGSAGYIKVEMGKDVCAIEQFAMYPVLDGGSTDMSQVCYDNKVCKSDADCNNVAGACQSGACKCNVCTTGKTCSSDKDCGGKTDACKSGKCACDVDTKCTDGISCSTDAGCGGVVGACSRTWSYSRKCTCTTECQPDRVCESDANCGGKNAACRSTGSYWTVNGVKEYVKQCDCDVDKCVEEKHCTTDDHCGFKAGACQDLGWYTWDDDGNTIPYLMCSC